jgi:hypothetical protein
MKPVLRYGLAVVALGVIVVVGDARRQLLVQQSAKTDGPSSTPKQLDRSGIYGTCHDLMANQQIVSISANRSPEVRTRTQEVQPEKTDILRFYCPELTVNSVAEVVEFPAL